MLFRSDITSSNFTVEAWIYLTASGSQYNIIVCGNSGGTTGWGFRVQATTGYLRFYYAGGSSVATTTAVTSNNWVHVAAVRSSTTVTIYINGVSSGSGTFSNGTATSASATIGADNQNGNLLVGYISNLRLIKGTAAYTSNFVPTNIPLTSVQNTALLLNGTSAGIYDSSMCNEFETVGASQISTSLKKYGNSSLYFDGSNGINLHGIGTSPTLTLGTGDFTIECWVYTLQTNAGYRYIIDFGPASTLQDQYIKLVKTNTNYIAWLGASATPRISSLSTISANTWYFVALCRSSGTTKLFIDGVSQGSISDTTNYSIASGRPIIGNGYSITDEPWYGYIDDFRITKGYARYTANFSVPGTPFQQY